MVRSKFPGKPSKIISRKIVDSAKFTLLEDNESTEAAENISYGLAMFNGSFGGDSQMETAFHGFSPHEVEEAFLASEEQKAKLSAEYEVCGLNEISKDVVKVNLDPPQVETLESEPGLLPWVEVARGHTWKGSTSVLSSCSSANSASGVVGSPRKFLLPNRSIHSSRVIKPNKRFLDLEEPSVVDHQKDLCPQNKQLRTIELKKPRLILHDIKSAVIRDSASNQSDNNLFRTFLTSGSLTETLESKCHWKACDKVQVGLGDLNVFGASVSQPCFHSIQSANNTSSVGNVEEHNYFSQSTSVIGRPGKVGVAVQKHGRMSRVPKRKSVGTPSSVKSETSSEGIFALRAKKPTGFNQLKVLKPAGTPIQCGVCGAVRSYRFVKQARKFGIDSCESCRKFIARMIIRARSDDNFVKCVTGEGSCSIPAAIRGTDSIGKESRCWACWLELCVRSYLQMPTATREALVAMLPTNVGLGLLPSKPRREPRSLRSPRTPASPRIAARARRKAAECINQGDESKQAPNRTERPSRAKEQKANEAGLTRGLEVARKKESDCIQTAVAVAVARQQLSQKGPRVKHVCRSASAVLGQPLAVFPTKSTTATTAQSSSTAKEPAHVPPATVKQTEPEPCRTRSMEAKASKSSSSGSQSTGRERETVSTSQSSHNVVSGRRITRLPQNVSPAPFRGHARSLQALSVCNALPEVVPDLVTLDFWESYDPDEVCNTGFGLIGWDPFQVRAVCFLCGSAGTSKLIHCASCCEPYHQFCVEMGVASSFEQDKWLVDWVCPRCTVCNGCGWSTGPQVRCQRCERSYHVNCLGATAIKAREKAPDRAWVCSACLRCKSCNGPDVVKFVGNLPFCKPCFKLRRKGSFCPLCQCCYNDNDFVSKMMECAECKAWVHAKCEGLSDEEYQVLSCLPETVEFVCRLCCTSPPAPWRAAVMAELKSGYLNVLKALTKNRKACTLLKWSPRKACCCQKPEAIPLQSGRRRLSFSTTPSKVLAQRQNQQLEKALSTTPVEKAVVKPEISLYDFDEEESEIGKYMNRSRTKKSQECQDNESTGSQEKGGQFSPLTGSQSDSGIGSTDDELKACSAAEDEETDVERDKLQSCCDICESISPIPSLLRIKKKVNSDEYSSILEFHQDMDSVMSEAESEELRDLYHYTLQEIFPWFDPKYPNMPHNWREAASPCKQSYGSVLQHQSTALSREKSSSIPDPVNKLIREGVEKMGKDYFYGGDLIPDARVCGFCKGKGDCASVEQGRLLYCGYNEWVHVNCALWSAGVFEEIDGALQNITSAMWRSRLIRCPACGKKGASVGCSAKNCQETYHFPCARAVACCFMEDKTVYCPSHVRESHQKTPAKDSDFCVYRPVYVELDRRKKKTVESRQVRLMIGSLLVESLGTILPEVSDQGSTLVPTGFRCSRLFWSVKEPWRIAQYTVRTSVQMPVLDSCSDQHVTVDHSKESEVTENASSIANTGKVVCDGTPCPEKDFNSDKDILDLVGNVETDVSCLEPSVTEVVREVINSLLDSVCTRETEEEVSDPQNSADLLPPELKDAIFEELPHDLLDGISVQDIFPRFLNLEDQSKEDFCEDTCDPVTQVMRDVRPSNHCSHGLTDNVAPPKNGLVSVTKRLKRSKSDVLPDHVASTDNRLHQRSCSLAWSCKLDTTISRCKRPLAVPESEVDRSRIIQQLHLSVTPASSVDAQYHFLGGDKENHSMGWRHAQTHIMQVDGAVDADPSDSYLSSTLKKCLLAKPLKETLVCSRRSRSFDLSEMSSFQTKRWSKSKPKIWRPRLSRLTMRVGSQPPDSDKRRDKWLRMRGSESYVIPQLDGALDASSDSEAEDVSVKAIHQQSYPLLEEQPVRCNRCRCTYRTEMSYTRHLPTCTADLSMSSGSEEDHSEDEAPACAQPHKAIAIVASESETSRVKTLPPAFASTTQPKPVQVTAPPPPPPTTIPEQMMVQVPNLTRNPAMPPPASTTTTTATTVTKPQSTTVTYTVTSQASRTAAAGAAQPTMAQPMPQPMTTSFCQQPIQIQPPQNPMVTMMDYQTQPPPSTPTVIVQCVPSPAMMPAYVDAFQQHTGQSLQHLATIEGAYITVPNQVLTPRTYHLQATADGQLRLEPTNPVSLSHLGIQLAPPQPQVVGTILTDSMYPTGNVLLASQPLLTCMETVVSNTYMSVSQNQFVPGMLANSSSFSSTTTQVFQASKMDQPGENPARFLVSNPQVPGQGVGPQQPSEPVFHLAANPSHKQSPVQCAVPDMFTQPLATQPHTLTTSLPHPILSQAASAQSRPVIHHQRTYSKSCKTDVAPLTTAQANSKAARVSRPLQATPTPTPTPTRPIAPARTTAPLPKKMDVPPVPLVQSANKTAPVCANLLVSPAPAQSITLPDPIAPPLTTDDSLPATNTTNISAIRNVPKSIAVVHPIPVSTYLPDKTKNQPLKKPTTCVVSTASSTMHSFITSLSRTKSIPVSGPATQPSSVLSAYVKNSCMQPTILKEISGLVPDTESKTCELSRPLEPPTSKLNLSSPSASTSAGADAVTTITKTSVPSPPEMLSLVCRTSLSGIPLVSVPTQVTSCTIALTNTVSSVRPVSTVLPTSCLSVTTKSPSKEAKTIPRRPSEMDEKLVPAVPAKKQSSSASGKAKARETSTPMIDLPPSLEDASAAVTVIPPTLREPHIGKSVCQSNSPERKFGTNRTSSQPINASESSRQPSDSNNKDQVTVGEEIKPQTTLKLLFQKQAHSGRYRVCSSSAKLNDSALVSCLKEKNSEKDQIIGGSTTASIQPEDSENVNPGVKAGKKSTASTPKVVYEIHCQDGFTYSSTSISDAWQKVFGAVQEARANHNMAPLVHNPFSGVDAAHNVLGLGNNSLKYLLEQLPSVGQCSQYRPVYHKSRLPSGPLPGGSERLTDERPLPESSSGCARTDPYACPKRFDMFSWLDSRHRCPPKLLDNADADGASGRRATSMNLPMAMRFRHLRETSRTSVGVFRSDIHGRGLFCLRDIEAGEMVIEYAGEVIRNTLTDNRERYYQSKGIGCYMFKVDENFTVDATRRGNAARFINHSCEPNCYSRVVDILGKKHIIIFAFRRIPQGEELTYDYKFPIEDEKISCHCLSRRCRKYLN